MFILLSNVNQQLTHFVYSTLTKTTRVVESENILTTTLQLNHGTILLAKPTVTVAVLLWTVMKTILQLGS